MTGQYQCARVEGMYYHFRQNNSRGYFKKPAVHVFVEAETPEQASERFLTIPGCYFDPYCRFDCSCCGSRWSNFFSDQLTAEDMRVMIEQEKESITAWLSEGISTAYILHSNGENETIP